MSSALNPPFCHGVYVSREEREKEEREEERGKGGRGKGGRGREKGGKRDSMDGEKQESGVVVQFSPLRFAAGPDLWSQLADAKLNDLRLSEESVTLCGSYEANRHAAIQSVLRVDSVHVEKELEGDDSRQRGIERLDQHDARESGSGNGIVVLGELVNFNTMESFKSCDRQKMLSRLAEKIVDEIQSGEAVTDPRLLTRFLILTFADLKTFRFIYWFAAPAILLPSPVTMSEEPRLLFNCYDTTYIELRNLSLKP